MNFKLGELFCGPGGLALGAKYAKINTNSQTFSVEHVWATDYDEDACNTFRYNISPNRPDSVVCHDIRNIKFNILKDISDIDALAFGFPCNDFSAVGEHKGINGKYGPLYTYCVKALKYFKPKWFLAENVSGLINSNDGFTFKIILKNFINAGYNIFPHLYKFDYYGVPQSRHRIIIIGIHKDLNVEFGIPSPEPYSHIDVSCKNAIENPPITSEIPNHDFTKQSLTVVERLKYIKPGENAFNAKLPKHLQLNIKGAKLSMIYKRLNPNKPSYTVTGSGGGGTHIYHWIENRSLTNRERARLQTFPDDFIFYGSKESVRKQIGMAVPVHGAKIIFESILKSFGKVDYSKINSNFLSFFDQHLFENIN